MNYRSVQSGVFFSTQTNLLSSYVMQYQIDLYVLSQMMFLNSSSSFQTNDIALVCGWIGLAFVALMVRFIFTYCIQLNAYAMNHGTYISYNIWYTYVYKGVIHKLCNRLRGVAKLFMFVYLGGGGSVICLCSIFFSLFWERASVKKTKVL